MPTRIPRPLLRPVSRLLPGVLACALAVAWAPHTVCAADAPAASAVPPTLQDLRRHMLEPPLNALAFRSMDRLFDVRGVPRSGPVWPLAREDRPLAFTYSVGGQAVPAEAFAGRTFTNALLVVKHGRIVHEA